MKSMTPASSEYFGEVAGQWDSIRSGYFTEAVREAAIRKAYLRPEMTVADVGAGTGFISAGLAPLVRQVYALDGSPAMLEIARRNLAGFSNVIYQPADGLSLPLPDHSLDAAFANMYLHHCPDPQAAIGEMVRLLRPGGRLVITDMDAHPYAWMKQEMADVWQGFDREQVRQWLQQAGLVNILIDCTGESCCAESASEMGSADERQARVSVFVATGTLPVGGVREAVQSGYGAVAEATPQRSSCCGSGEAQQEALLVQSSSCCGPSDQLITIGDAPGEIYTPGYSPEQQAQAPEQAVEISLGCGNPVALANLRPGETVLDIGSGGGLDAFLAARQVGPTGRVIGVDMTPQMLERARRTAKQAGLDDRVEFRQGQAEALPVEDASVDVILSNCVINLCEDKGRVFAEAHRALRPGGRLEISDVVTDWAFPLEMRQNPAGWPSCVFGALPEAEYLDLIRQAGFMDIKLRRSQSADLHQGVKVYSLGVSAVRGAG